MSIRPISRHHAAEETALANEKLYGQYAGFATRAVAFVIDLLVVTAILLSIGLARSLMDQYFGSTAFAEKFMDLVFLVVSIAIFTGYPMVFWMLIGQTPGKYLMGLRVIRMDGSRVTIGTCIRRVVGYYISAFLFLGYLWVLINDRRQGWHDIIGGTFVVYTWSKDPTVQRVISRTTGDVRAARQNNRKARRSGIQ